MVLGKYIQQNKADSELAPVIALAERLVADVSSTFSTVPDVALLAAILDPRFKNMSAFSSESSLRQGNIHCT